MAPDGLMGGRDPVVAMVRELLAGVPGSAVFLEPEFGPGGEVADFRFAAASPDAVDIGGRRGPELVGANVLQTYPGVDATDLWQGYLSALATGVAYEGELEYEEASPGIPHRSRYSVRAVPCVHGLLVSWNRLDSGEREQRRLVLMQRLGRLGWVDRDLVRGEIVWSDEVYSIFGRDPSLGPMPLEDLAAKAEDEDGSAAADAVRRLLEDGEPLDRTFRIRLADQQVRHVRVVAETESDVHGRPVHVHGFFQDVSAAKHAEQQLLEQQQAALAQQSLLAAERDLAARLQDTLLPLPQQKLDLAGLTVDVAYQPVHEGLNLGGDWYSAIELPDGNALLVVGDVAGHGLDAVATMALLRFTAKGMAITGTPLPTVLSNLNTLLLHTSERDSHTASMIMAVYEPSASRLTWVRAGHPPPLLVRDGDARFLPTPAGILLGATAESRYEASTLDLRPGDHLLLYTDGLVERPGEPLDAGLVRLARTVLAHADAPRFLDGLIRDLVTPEARRDDICVLHISR
ncbi:PP2C family protein-serine/threonine phosphatase [Yinghuangia seranimata]|uniref:PP2C family protein-serine/threonine phosphatase n=1 Tax=Yinghuangia seranimata TaxID=408067 RepID=UPI00248ACCC8|nr:SpoIIE family protein phosphatase [Yinghuangia seranimata]MDI2128392.1 SpoIIE family protein phosphatase [Yinghuangia seranimata]